MEQLTKKPLTPYIDFAVTSVRNHIDTHPLDWKTIDDLSELVAINRKCLQQAFKYKYGTKIRDHQLLKRMECAAQMISEGRLPTKLIAAKCGYNDSHNFSRAFKSIYKCSPKEWLRVGITLMITLTLI